MYPDSTRSRGKEDPRIEQLESRIHQLESLLAESGGGTGSKLGSRSKNQNSHYIVGLLLGVFILTYVYVVRQSHVQHTIYGETSSGGMLSRHDNGDIVRIPTTMDSNGNFVVRSLEDRLRLLEAKVNGRNNWITDPRITVNIKYQCKNRVPVSEHYLCLDNFNPKTDKCIVYDMGIRRQPEFGKEMIEKYGCEVHAFDPSPVTNKDLNWIKANGLDVPNYHFHPYGAGGFDGDLSLFEYNWDQVSPILFPDYVTAPCDNTTLTNDNKFRPKCTRVSLESKRFSLPVKTLPTIMKELGHTEVTFIKLDVEGSEFAFLEDAIDRMGCLPVKQMSIEWHHFTFDNRYGGGSSPEMNAILAPLHMCGMRTWQRDYEEGGFPDDAKFFLEAGMTLRYTTTSHIQI